MRIASVLSFVMAAVLLIAAAVGFVNDERAIRELGEVGLGSLDFPGRLAGINQALDERHASERIEAVEAVAGAVFLIAGFALWSRRHT